MIDLHGIMSIELLKKEAFNGSFKGMRYRLEKDEQEDGISLKTWIWPQPFAFTKTKEELKSFEKFSFDPEGIEKSIAWLNEQYKEREEYWETQGFLTMDNHI